MLRPPTGCQTSSAGSSVGSSKSSRISTTRCVRRADPSTAKVECSNPNTPLRQVHQMATGWTDLLPTSVPARRVPERPGIPRCQCQPGEARPARFKPTAYRCPGSHPRRGAWSRFDPDHGIVFFNDVHGDYLMVKDSEAALLDYLATLVAKEYVVYNNPLGVVRRGRRRACQNACLCQMSHP